MKSPHFMKKIAFLTGFLIISFFSNAQLPKLEWAKGIGSKNGEDNPLIKMDSSGNLIIVGTFSDSIDFDLGAGTFILAPATKDATIFILKLDSTGNFIWADKIDGVGFARPEEIVLDRNNNIYITGHFYNSTDFDPGIGTSILKSVGKTYLDGDVFIAKYNASGDFIWAKAFGGPSSEVGLSIAVDKLGNVYTCGRFEDSTDFDPGAGKYYLKAKDPNDAFISKLDVSGNFVWAKYLGGDRSEANCIAVDSEDNIYVSGIYRGSEDFDFGTDTFIMTPKGYSDIFILKLDTQANFIWAKSIGGTSADYLSCMVLDSSGNIFLTGLYQDYIDVDPGPKNYYLTHKGNLDIFLVKLNNEGIFKRALSIGNTDYEVTTDMDLDKQGNIYLTGEFRGKTDFDPGNNTFFCTAAGWDLFVLKLDSSGDFVWEFNIGGSKYEHGSSITLDNAGYIYSAGVIQTVVDCDPGSGKFEVNHLGLNDIFIAKYNDSVGMKLEIDEEYSLKKGNIIIYPNPNSGNFTIEIDNPEKDISVEVYNLIGEKIKTIETVTSQSQYSVDLNLANGIYVVKVRNGGMVYNQKVNIAK